MAVCVNVSIVFVTVAFIYAIVIPILVLLLGADILALDDRKGPRGHSTSKCYLRWPTRSCSKQFFPLSPFTRTATTSEGVVEHPVEVEFASLNHTCCEKAKAHTKRCRSLFPIPPRYSFGVRSVVSHPIKHGEGYVVEDVVAPARQSTVEISPTKARHMYLGSNFDFLGYREAV